MLRLWRNDRADEPRLASVWAALEIAASSRSKVRGQLRLSGKVTYCTITEVIDGSRLRDGLHTVGQVLVSSTLYTARYTALYTDGASHYCGATRSMKSEE